MKNIERNLVIRTTLGELIAALTEEAFCVAQDEKEANELVAVMLSDLLSHADSGPERWH
ncbi:MAG: hypothetical protein HYV04_16190 [Deltaproteobacteria bacterium]|nr:hypothetical protein [Deltaproteobacteria bacterium]